MSRNPRPGRQPVYTPRMMLSVKFGRIYRTVSAVLVCVLYGLAFFSLKSAAADQGLGGNADVQTAFLLIVMAVLSVAFHSSVNVVVRGAALLLQYLGGLFLGVLVGPHAWLPLLWVGPLILQFGQAMPPIPLVLFSIIVVLSHFGHSEPVVAWSRTLADSEARDRAVGAGVSLAVLLAVVGLRYVHSRLAEQEALVENLKTNILKLTRANYDFQRYAADAEEITLKRERQRISREIHDTVGYTMTTLRMMLEAGMDLILESPLKMEVQLAKALELMDRGHNDIRVSLLQLRERESERPRGLKGLKNLINLFSETTGVSVRTEWGNLPWLFPDEVEVALYRFVQEGMSNALSHGNAKEIDIYFRMEGSDFVVILSDDGAGADVLIEGMGLHGMRERIEECGGEFEARNTKEGFFLQARLPLRRDGNAEDPPVDR